jgi:ParB/RepB/Spo0J family partition protein
MTTTTTKPATKAATPKTPPKVSHAKTKAPELPAISSVKLVPLALIDIEPQVRTIFDDASIADLAADIQARGLLQPVLLNPHGSRFTLIAGERRVRACRLAELTDIPALITKASQADALLMQLAENIQREDLDLQDQVTVIRQLHDHLGSVGAVADTVKKSSAWVSKRLALSHEGFGWMAKRMMEDGITEDVEILNTLSQLEKMSYRQAVELEKQLRDGTATRESARAMLKELKNPTPKPVDPKDQEREQEREQQRAKANAEYAAHEKERKEGTGPEFVRHALYKLQVECIETTEHGNEGTAYLNTLRDDQRAAILAHLQTLQTTAASWNLTELAFAFTPYDSDYGYLEKFAIVLALKKQPVNLYAMVTLLEDANRFKEQDA